MVMGQPKKPLSLKSIFLTHIINITVGSQALHGISILRSSCIMIMGHPQTINYGSPTNPWLWVNHTKPLSSIALGHPQLIFNKGFSGGNFTQWGSLLPKGGQ